MSESDEKEKDEPTTIKIVSAFSTGRPHRRMRGGRRSRSNSSGNSSSADEGTKKMRKKRQLQQQMFGMEYSFDGKRQQWQQGQQMARAGLICSLLLLATVCAAHLLLVAEKTNGGQNTVFTEKAIQIHQRSAAENGKKMLFFPREFAQNQVDWLAHRLAGLPVPSRADGQRQQNLHVNMMVLTEQRRRTVQQRQHRSPTPIPSGATATMRRPFERARSQEPTTSNMLENMAANAAAELDNDEFGRGDEPTLMDYDAIDAYWRWDIEQEKGGVPMVPAYYQQQMQMPQPQQQQLQHYQQHAGVFMVDQQQQFRRNNLLNPMNPTEPAELLYQRDIQLLTEKSLFPELPTTLPPSSMMFYEENGGAIAPEAYNYFYDEKHRLFPTALVEDEQLQQENEDLYNSNIGGKWENAAVSVGQPQQFQQQWPTAGSSSGAGKGESHYFWEEDGRSGGTDDDGGQQSTTTKLLPFFQHVKDNEDEGICSDLLLTMDNIPIATPELQELLAKEEEEDEEEEHKEEQQPPIVPFSPEQQHFADEQQPILFNDVSLADAALVDEATDSADEEEEENLAEEEREEEESSAHLRASTSSAVFANHQQHQHIQAVHQEEAAQEEEDDEDMLLSALFPQLFPPEAQLLPSPASSPLLDTLLQMSIGGANANGEISEMNNNGNNNVEAILRNLTTVELMLANQRQLQQQIQQQQIQEQQLQQSPPPLAPLMPMPVPIHRHYQQHPMEFVSPFEAVNAVGQQFSPPAEQFYLPPPAPFTGTYPPTSPEAALSPMLLEQFINQSMLLGGMNVPMMPNANGLEELYCPAAVQNGELLLGNMMMADHNNEISPNARCSSTTSSGFGSSAGAVFSIGSTSPPAFRYEDKLVPKDKEMNKEKKQKSGKMTAKSNDKMKKPKLASAISKASSQSDEMAPAAVKGKRGRRSKDDSLVNQHGLPCTAEQLAAMPYREYAALMQSRRLSTEQKAMIKKIRRRGRNKLAARKCRERRLNQNGEYEDVEEREEDQEEDDLDLLDIDVVGDGGGPFTAGDQQQHLQGGGGGGYVPAPEWVEEEEEAYDPAGISLYPSTSSASSSNPVVVRRQVRNHQPPVHQPHQQQQLLPSRMQTGRHHLFLPITAPLTPATAPNTAQQYRQHLKRSFQHQQQQPKQQQKATAVRVQV